MSRSDALGYKPVPLDSKDQQRMTRGGENALHIAVVNQHEDWVLQAIGALPHGEGVDRKEGEGGGWRGRKVAELSDEQLFSVLTQKADGPAFNHPPALHFGSTVIAYAAVFGMRRVLHHVFAERFPIDHPLHEVGPNLHPVTLNIPPPLHHLLPPKVYTSFRTFPCTDFHPSTHSPANFIRLALHESAHTQIPPRHKIQLLTTRGEHSFGLLSRAMYDYLISAGANDQVKARGLTPLKMCVYLGCAPHCPSLRSSQCRIAYTIVELRTDFARVTCNLFVAHLYIVASSWRHACEWELISCGPRAMSPCCRTFSSHESCNSKLKMFEHLVRSRIVHKSAWGPVREGYIALDEIDSMGLPGEMQASPHTTAPLPPPLLRWNRRSSLNHPTPSLLSLRGAPHDPPRNALPVLELITMKATHPDSRRMLSDEFMGGFLWQLISHKWYLWGRTFHLLITIPEIVRTVLLTYLATPSAVESIPNRGRLDAWLQPGYDENTGSKNTETVAIALMAVLLMRDFFEAFFWIIKRR
ncbi:MAG: hypothetical protein SGPRY_011958, partial [Prymnesium sp.]